MTQEEKRLYKHIRVMSEILEDYRKDYCDAAGLGGSDDSREFSVEYAEILDKAYKLYPELED